MPDESDTDIRNAVRRVLGRQESLENQMIDQDFGPHDIPAERSFAAPFGFVNLDKSFFLFAQVKYSAIIMIWTNLDNLSL